MSKLSRRFAAIATTAAAAFSLAMPLAPVVPAAAQPITVPAESVSYISATTAGSQTVGVTSNVWGTVSGGPNTQVFTEVLIGNQWSRSQTSTTNASGYYAIPLTYGQHSVGSYTYRVGAVTSEGVKYSEPVTLNRVASVTASSAGHRAVGVTTYVWGTVRGGANAEVFTQALINGSWSRSQVGRANSSGYYTLPLTYGQNSAGQYTYRIGARTSQGTVYSPSFTFTRVGPVTASTAGSQVVGVTSYAWGTVGGTPNSTVFTEVLVNGQWARSQTASTNSSGSYTLPLTYGQNSGAPTPTGSAPTPRLA